jgi:predicted SnoaL-like aldol condensation-catalyzing enzyme
MTSDPIRALAYRMHQAFNDRDFAATADILAPDFVSHPLGTVGPEPVARSWAAMAARYPEARSVVETVLVEGDHAAIRSRVVGIGPADAVPELFEVFQAADGRIAELWGAARGLPGF